MQNSESILQHLKSRIKIVNGCWEYQVCGKRDKYGLIEINGKTKRAHRISYELFVNEIPNGMCVCHKCDNPPCINPEHLFIGTNHDNRMDSVNKKRHSRGISRPLAKFNEEEIREIRELYFKGHSIEVLALKYKVNYSTMYRIVKRHTWSHI